MKFYNDNLFEKLKKVRNDKGLSIEDLSSLTGVDTYVIESYENGVTTDIAEDDFKKILDALEVNETTQNKYEGKSMGEIIKTRRKELKMTQKEVANHINVSHSAVSRWESGDIENITQDKIAGLADILKLSPLTLIEPSTIDKENYSVNQEYLDILARIQELQIPIKTCNQFIDIFEDLRKDK